MLSDTERFRVIEPSRSGPRHREAGIALVHVIVIGAALFGLATAVLVASRTDQMVSNNIVSGTKAFWVAAAGLETAKAAAVRTRAACLAANDCAPPQSLLDGSYTVTIVPYDATTPDPRWRIRSVGIGPNNARKVVEEIVVAPFFNGNQGLIQIDGDRLPADFEDPGGAPGVRIPDWTIDGRDHDPRTLELVVAGACPDAPPIGGEFDPANTAMQNELDDLRCRIVQRANECCTAAGTTPGEDFCQWEARVCVPGECDGSASCTEGTCDLGTCYPGSCRDGTCAAASCPIAEGGCAPGSCTDGDASCATGTCVVNTAGCGPGICADNSCAPATCSVGTCTEGTDCPPNEECVVGWCKNGNCSPGDTCRGNNCVEARCVIDDTSCAPGTCSGSNCTTGTCPISSCSANACTAESCVTAACAVGECAEGECTAAGGCAAGSCPATCSEGGSCEGLSNCVSATCSVPDCTPICPELTCESDRGLYYVRGEGANPVYQTPYSTDLDLRNETPDVLPWTSACSAPDPGCCESMNLEDPELRALGTPIADNLPAAPSDRGPLVPDTPRIDDDPYPIRYLTPDERQELEAKIDGILLSALGTPAEERRCITTQHIRGESHVWGTLDSPEIVIVADTQDQNPMMRALSESCPNAGQVHDLTIDGNSIVQGAGLLILPRNLVIKEATFEWKGLVVVLERGRIEAWNSACGGIWGGLLMQKDNTGNDARLDLDKNTEDAATCGAPNNAFSINYSCEAIDMVNDELFQSLSWSEVFDG